MKRLLLLCLFAATSVGQTLDLKSLDRFVATSSDSVDVHLDGSVLRMAAAFLSGDKADEGKVKKLVAGLTGVYVKSFEFDNARAFVESDLNAIRAQLKGPEWSRVMSYRSQKDGESSEIYLRAPNARHEGGLAVIALEKKQLTVVQVLGSISLADLSALSSIPGIPDIKTKSSEKEK